MRRRIHRSIRWLVGLPHRRRRAPKELEEKAGVTVHGDEEAEGDDDMATRKYSELRAKMAPEARSRVDARVLATLKELPLLELRKARSLSQEQLAKELQTTQGEISKIEHRTDMYLSTPRNYVEAMGGELDII